MKFILTSILTLLSFVGVSQSDAAKNGDQDYVQQVMQFIEKNEDHGNAKIRLKGMKGEPLLIWNGEETTKGMLSLIGPEDVESILVSRSGKEVEKFEEKAKYGVVFIQTKPYKNTSVAYIYKGELLYDFSFEQVVEARAEIVMVDPKILKDYLDIEIADHVQNVQIINSPELTRELAMKSAKDDNKAWDYVWANNKSVERNKRKLEKEAQRKKKD